MPFAAWQRAAWWWAVICALLLLGMSARFCHSLLTCTGTFLLGTVSAWLLCIWLQLLLAQEQGDGTS